MNNYNKMKEFLTFLVVTLAVTVVLARSPKSQVQNQYLKLTFSSGAEACLGNDLTPTEVKDQPCVSYPAYKKSFYTLVAFGRTHGDEEVLNNGTLSTERTDASLAGKILADPDYCIEGDWTYDEWLHWLIVNIPGNHVAKGEEFVQYICPAPFKGTGFHRYTFLVYKQPRKLHFNETKINGTTYQGRKYFCLSKFAEKYCLGNPVTGNYHYSQYDDYVPLALKKLGAEQFLKEYTKPV